MMPAPCPSASASARIAFASTSRSSLVRGARGGLEVARVDVEVGRRVVSDRPKLVPHRLPGLARNRAHPLLGDQGDGGRVVDGDRPPRPDRIRIDRGPDVGRASGDGIEQPRVGGAGRRHRLGLLEDQHVDRPHEAPLRRSVDRAKDRIHPRTRPGARGIAVVDVVVDDPQLRLGNATRQRERDGTGECSYATVHENSLAIDSSMPAARKSGQRRS